MRIYKQNHYSIEQFSPNHLYLSNKKHMTMTEQELDIFPETLRNALAVKTAATEAELASDDWDSENNCSYSADGTRLLDAENFPDEVTVREGARNDLHARFKPELAACLL